MKRCVIFDMDGVLLDSEYGAFSHVQKALRRLGADISMDYLTSLIGRTSAHIYRRIIDDKKLDLSVEQIRSENNRYGSFYETADDLKMMDGLLEFIGVLEKRKISMAVVSSTSAGSVLTTLNRLDILKHMRFVLAGDMIKESKPSPLGYRTAMRYLNAEPEECVIFEDSPVGIQAAKNSGAKVIGFKGSVITQDTSVADFEISSYAEAIEKVEDILAD